MTKIIDPNTVLQDLLKENERLLEENKNLKDILKILKIVINDTIKEKEELRKLLNEQKI